LFKFFAPSNLKTYGSTLGKAAANQPLTRVESEGRMSSAVGITRLMRDASRDDIRTAIELFAIINIFVGMFNMLPLLPLDGGHVLVATYERLRSFGGRRHFVDFRRLLPVTYVVLLVMAVIGFSSLYLDITKPLSLF
jgi:membrane-associated protease RseP (regulator of RpoE activity)